MRKWLLLAFIVTGAATLGYFDWQDSISEDATYIQIGMPILHHTWTCADGAAGCTTTTNRTCAGTSCVITVGSTTAGSVEIACGQMASTTITVTMTGDGTWVTANTGGNGGTGSHGTDSTAGGVECAYNLNATGGATSITCTFSTGSASNQCMYLRFTGTGSSFTFDSGNNIDDSANSLTPSAVALTLGTANNYILIQTSSCGGSCTAINQSYTGFFFNGDGMAYKMNVSTAGTTPLWTQSPTGHLAGGGIAIYEVVAGGAVAGFDKRKKLEKLGL